jgi:CheY-like chemotaxis protein
MQGTPSNSHGSAAPSGLRILLVEDHDDTRRVIERILSARGYVVTPAASVAAGLAAADQQTFDLVVSDIGLPDGDGYQLMASLRQKHGLAGIAISGFGFTEDIARSTKAGFFAHLTKPISVPVIEQTIARLRRDIAQRFQEESGSGEIPAV